MAIFGKKNKSVDLTHEKITKEDEKRMKMRSQNLHDPILTAMNNAQPYEEMNVHQRTSSLGDGVLNDVFGRPIVNPDVSNPSRDRDERPLDTIRAFEYSVSQHPAIPDQLETHTLGWGVRDDYPLSNGQIPPQMNQQQAVYSPPAPSEPVKKKRSLFSWKKK